MPVMVPRSYNGPPYSAFHQPSSIRSQSQSRPPPAENRRSLPVGEGRRVNPTSEHVYSVFPSIVTAVVIELNQGETNAIPNVPYYQTDNLLGREVTLVRNPDSLPLATIFQNNWS
jgi:hypothetical protein